MQADTAKTPKVAVVVLTWNGRQLTLDCLESLANVTWPNLHVIVVDNASTDGTPAAIESAFGSRFGDRLTVIVNPENLGFSGGNNVGIRHAMDTGSAFVLLLNNDTRVDPGFLEPMVAVFEEHPHTGIAGPKIYYETPSDRIWFAGGEIFLWRGTARHIGIRETDRGQYDAGREVDYVTGCTLLTTRDVIGKIGMLDDSYRAYYEDADFCMRAKGAGFHVRYVPEGRVWHRISSSTGGQVSRRKVTTKFGSTLRFFWRYASFVDWLTIPLFFTADVVRIALLVLTGRIRDERESST